MSSFWLGATVALGTYYAIETVLSIAYYGHEFEIDSRNVAEKLAITVVLFAIANLLHVGVIG